MRHLLATALFLIVLINGVMAQSSLESFKSLKWSNRIILVNSNVPSERIVGQLESRNLDIVDRDILWFLLHKDDIETNYSGEIGQGLSTFIKSMYFEELATRVVLLGKDGDVKEVSDELNLSELFVLIDGMPMRRVEVNQNVGRK